MAYKAYKYRLYPTADQKLFFEKSIGCVRFVYNQLLERSLKEYQNSGKFILGYSLTNELTRLKKEFPWLKEVNSQSLQQSSLYLSIAFKNKFSKARKKSAGFPKFKSKRIERPSFSVPQHFSIRKEGIKIPKVGWINCRIHRNLEGKAKSLTISKDVDQWFVSILCEQEDVHAEYDPDNVIGIDLGIKTFAITSDGEYIEYPDLENHYKKLKMLQRRHSKKKKGSKNRNKARIKVAKQYRKIRRVTKNFIETSSAAIAKLYDVVSIETLNICGMKKNKRLSGTIQKLSWHAFTQALERKVKVVHRVGTFYPSSKTCSCCGWIKKDLTLSERTFSCDSCGCEMDRDVNAATNLLNEYKRTVATAGIACGENIRPKDSTGIRRQSSMKQEYGFVETQAINALA